MIRKDLPSASGLPDEWDRDMELRLGFLEAQDEARDPRTIINVLKHEFPELSEVSVLYNLFFASKKAKKVPAL